MELEIESRRLNSGTADWIGDDDVLHLTDILAIADGFVGSRVRHYAGHESRCSHKTCTSEGWGLLVELDGRGL